MPASGSSRIHHFAAALTSGGHDGAIAAYVTLALNSEDGKRQIDLSVNSMTLNDQVGSKRAQQALGRLFKTADCGT